MGEADGKTRILTFGVFDLFHYGHKELFRKAKEMGGPHAYLIVAVHDEAFIRQFKPDVELVYSTQERLEMVQQCRYVDEAVLYKTVAQGVREIILVAQDTTRYGSDTKRGGLAELLRAAAHVEGVEWVRFLYAYPEMLTDEMIAAMVEEEHVCKYVDIPLQHCNDRILKKMNRHVTRAQIEALLEKLAAQPVRIAVRTTLMTGFPSETLEEHEELLDFMRKWRFDRLGAFAFCPEEGTAAEKMDGQIDEDEKQRRLDEIMALQQEISLSNNIARAKTGGEETVVVDSFDRNEGVIYTRSQYEVPEVDGSILLPLAPEDPDPIVGMTLAARLTDAMAYDLIGELE